MFIDFNTLGYITSRWDITFYSTLPHLASNLYKGFPIEFLFVGIRLLQIDYKGQLENKGTHQNLLLFQDTLLLLM